MIANLIGGFVTILIGTSLIGPISTQVNTTANACPAGYTHYAGAAASAQCWDGVENSTNVSQNALYTSSTWASDVLKLVPGFFALGLLGVGIAVTYSSLRQAGVV